ncbi:MAG: NAD(P)-dependent oxidoreductase [Gammaproteobacteria bacterium]|nr:NAD(P)-dependent oxidoreductase [Gammaproteobacteria bacterium]MBU1978067.1 NAD(P)-dependent oxidoreductase [Gammaproteobacteria bacterium]
MSHTPAYAIEQDLADITSRLDDLWDGLRNESIFITGGTGLFGRWLLESLAHANRDLHLNLKMTVLTRNAQAFQAKAPHLANDPAIDFHRGDVRDFAFPKRHYSYIIHGATTSAEETFRGEDPLCKFDTLVAGTRHTLEFAAQCHVKRFLFLSSGVAYGVPPAGIDFITEDYSGAPDTTDVDSALGQAKRTAEFLCAYYAQKNGWGYSIARCFSFVGPFLPLDIHYAIGNFIGQALFEDEITVQSDGSPVRSYLYMADLVNWLLTLLLKGKNGQIYNVGSDQAVSIRGLAYLVRDVLSPHKPVKVLGQPNASVGNAVRNRYVPSIAKARAELGLDVSVALNEAIRRTSSHVTGCAIPKVKS